MLHLFNAALFELKCVRFSSLSAKCVRFNFKWFFARGVSYKFLRNCLLLPPSFFYRWTRFRFRKWVKEKTILNCCAGSFQENDVFFRSPLYRAVRFAERAVIESTRVRFAGFSQTRLESIQTFLFSINWKNSDNKIITTFWPAFSSGMKKGR